MSKRARESEPTVIDQGLVATAPPAAPPVEYSVAGDPEYSAALSNRAKLKARERELRAALMEQNRRPRQRGNAPEAVAALVVGLQPADPLEPAYDHAEAEQLRAELSNIEHATALQERAIQRIHEEASIRVCRAAAPDHHALVRQIAIAASALQDAVRAEAQFRGMLSGNNVTPSHLPLVGEGLVMPAPACNGYDQSSYVSRFLDKAREYGLI